MARLKFTVYFAVFLLVSGCLLFGALSLFVSSEFERIEENEAGFGISRATAAISADNASLLAWVRDVAPWDDTYSFAETRDPAYIADNYDPQAIANLDFDLILFADNSGAVMWSHVSESGGIEDLYYEDLLNLARRTPDWESGTGVAGLYRMAADSIYLIAAHPIQTSEYGGPSRGTTVLGRRLDNARFEKLIASSVADFELRVIGDDPLVTGFVESVAAEENGLGIRRENGETKAYTVLKDMNDQAAILLEIRAHKDVTKNGSNAVRAVLIVYLLTALLGFVAFIVVSGRAQ